VTNSTAYLCIGGPLAGKLIARPGVEPCEFNVYHLTDGSPVAYGHYYLKQFERSGAEVILWVYFAMPRYQVEEEVASIFDQLERAGVDLTIAELEELRDARAALEFDFYATALDNWQRRGPGEAEQKLERDRRLGPAIT
jgi:hypothetical protein